MSKKRILSIIMLVVLAAGIALAVYGATGTAIYNGAASMLGGDKKAAIGYIQNPESLKELSSVEKLGADKVKSFLKGLGADAAAVDAAVEERANYEKAVANSKDRDKFLAYAQSVDETVNADNLNDLIKDHDRSDPMRAAMAMQELGITDEEAFNKLASNEALLGLYQEGLPKLLEDRHMTNGVVIQFIGIVLIVIALAYFVIQAMDIKPRAKTRAANPKTARFTGFLLNYALFIILGLILVVVSIIRIDFLSMSNILNILQNASTKGILALGCAGLIVLAGTDLSIGRVLGISAAVTASLVQIRVSRRKMELMSKESGMTYAMISGIQKIKNAGAEKRAFARWAGLYAEETKLSTDPPLFLKLNGVLSTAVTMAGTIVIYLTAIRAGLSASEYMAFMVAYGQVSGAFSALTDLTVTIASIKPMVEMVKPILEAECETQENKMLVTSISGRIDVSNVSFRYTDDSPMILDDLSLSIQKGDYVAIVGETGCGKSTLIRLMLGFEKPSRGAVYYDHHDLNSLDPVTLRRNIGSVMQDGKLMMGDIFQNITLSAPWLKLQDAWEAAELAGISEEIREMPMGMFTMISENGGGISGGQKQRILIARAVAAKPKILIFDEATSALDNITQKKISDALDRLACTRIVIAHRLSTIRNCSRILVMKDGKIAGDGTYEELIEKNAYFAELVERQRLDKE